jgi:hypothetical protein
MGFELSAEYLRWNRVLAEHCLLEQTADAKTAYLSITPRILAAALEAREGIQLAADDAANEFVSAVSAAYVTQVLNQAEGLWVLSSPTRDGLPWSIALLALSVLAAYEMHGDEEAGPNAYYLRLAALLGCDLVGGRPRGFDPEDFADLWQLLSRWLVSVTGRSLALPGPDAGLRRFVAYPLCHVPLRQLDVEKLPEFFDWAGLEPGSRSVPSVLGEALRRWALGRGVLTNAGEAAIADERRAAVEVEVALELEAWDGSWCDAIGRRIAAVHLLLDFVRRRPRLDFLARRPASFPASFDGGPRVLEAGEQGWYDPIPVMPEDGRILEDGFTWTCAGPLGSFSFRRPPCCAIALSVTADFSGFLSQRGLPLGMRNAVLCTEGVEAAVEKFLTDVTGVRCRAVDDAALPQGWRLFTEVTPITEAPVPRGLEALEVQSEVSVVLRGGLRLGRRAAWLAGAPPTILVAGRQDVTASLDGSRAAIVDGVVRTTQPLSVGVHVVEAAACRRRFEIVEPEGRWGECIPVVAQHNGAPLSAVALPPGCWSVIGATPGEVAEASSGVEGCLVVVRFRPVWAVSTGARRGSTVVALADRRVSAWPVDARLGRHRSAAWAWVSVIYEAQIRRPRFATYDSKIERGRLVDLWGSYVRAAKSLKRKWRRAS